MDGTVLVADDDRTIRTVLTQALTRAGCRVHATSSLSTLMRWVAEGKGDAIITDVVMPDGNGIEMLPKIKELRADLPVIVISAQNTIMTAIQATEAKAFDYLPKPFDLPDLMKRTARALEQTDQAARRATQAQTENERPDDLPLVGRTVVMQALFRSLAQIMHSNVPMLIVGETGTGKTLITKIAHDYSDRRAQPFVVATASDLHAMDGPERILARAKSGTIVFDEISGIDSESQVNIVRMIDASREGGPRFVATTQTNLAQALKQGQLRQDLYYRLGGATLTVPTLRERVDDITLLNAHFLANISNESGTNTALFLSPEALEHMRAYRWPGNVRQLENALRRLALGAQGDQITASDVEMMLAEQPEEPPVAGSTDSDRLAASVGRHLRRYFDLHGGMLPPNGLYARILREIETPLIEIALEATGGNQAKCADLLGINRNTLRKKIAGLDIHVTRRRKLM